MLGSPKFPPLEKERKTHQKSAPQDKKKKNTPGLTKRGNSNVLAQGWFIRVLAVPCSSPADIRHDPMRGCTVAFLCGAGKRGGSASHHYFLSSQAPEGDDFIPFRTNNSGYQALIGQILMVWTFPSRPLTRLMHGCLKYCWGR